MEISEELAHNIVKDWEKKDIPLKQKSEFIKALLKEKDISQRELARRLCVPQGTLNSWVTMYSSQEAVKENKVNKQEVIYLSSRLIFVLSKMKDDLSPKALSLLCELKSELEKRSI